MKLFHAFIAAATIAISAGPALAVPQQYPNPGVESQTAAAFAAGRDGVLYGYYTGARGGFTVLAGARINGIDTPTGLNNQLSAYGTRFNFGNVSAGDSVAFFIDVLNTGDRFYSDSALNSDGINHVWFNPTPYGGDAFVPAGFNLAFEDLRGGGDFSYFDHSFVIGIGNVPEPSSWLLMVAGFGLVGVSMRRHKVQTA